MPGRRRCTARTWRRPPRRWRSRTVHTTIANYQLRPRYRYVPALVNYEKLTPCDSGGADRRGIHRLHGISTAMEAAGYRGAVAYEMCSPLLGGGSLENLDRYARKFLEFMRGFRQAARQGA